MIYVDPEKLETAAGNFAAHEKTLNGILSQLEGDLAPMIASWEGSAQELYVQKKAAWDAAAADLAAMLGAITSNTRKAHQSYVDLITETKAMWTP
jgi:ESAT-6 family protein